MRVELRQVGQRLASTRQIRKVTRALDRVSAARLVRDRQELEAFRPYARAVSRWLNEIRAAEPLAEHEFLLRGRGEARGLIVFGTDRGLCGGLNSELAFELERFANLDASRPARLVVMGKTMAKRARRIGLPIDAFVPTPARQDRQEVLDRLEELAVRRFLDGPYGDVSVLYARFVSAVRRVPALQRILPVPPLTPERPGSGEDSARGVLRAAIFEPGHPEVLGRILSEFVRRSIQAAFLNGVASENAARQEAMSRATENADKICDELVMEYSRLRQESITTEMLELTAASSA